MSVAVESETKMVTTQIRCPFCNKRANDVVYPVNAPTFRVETVCQNRLCRRWYTTTLPRRGEKGGEAG